MFNKWAGIFAPIMTKHRDYCGDIENHIEVQSVEKITEEIRERVSLEIEDRVRLGQGSVEWLATVGFIEGEQLYEFIILAGDKQPDDSDIVHEIAGYFEPETGT